MNFAVGNKHSRMAGITFSNNQLLGYMKSLALYNTLKFTYLQRKIALQISFGQQVLGPFSLHNLIFKILVFCFSQSHNTS